jgi:hypothetical protein
MRWESKNMKTDPRRRQATTRPALIVFAALRLFEQGIP